MIPLLDKKTLDTVAAQVDEAFDLLHRIADAQERIAAALERLEEKAPR